jgi:hypothetical protein
MKKWITCCLFALLTLPALAVEGSPVKYTGGTVPALSAGGVGRFDTTSEASLTFEYSGKTLAIPYTAIDSYDYTHEVTRHLGVLPAILVGLLRARRHQHYFRISYHDEKQVSQVAIFEVPKHMPRVLQAVLAARAPRVGKSYVPCGCQN